jgi:hypothetical protein
MRKVITHNILTILLISLAGTVLGQEFPSRIWHEGYLVTSKEDTVRGMVKYDMDTDIVQVRINDQQVKTFSSKQILYFEIYDKTVKNYRQFYALPFQVRVNFKTQSLFEVLYEGPLTLLVKEKIITVSDPYNQAYINGPVVSREKLSYSYYFIDQKGKMMEYTSGKRNDLLDIMKKKAPKVKEYIKHNKLRTDRMRDIVRITAFYNSL